MNIYQKIAFATGFVFILFIIILALLDFDNVVLVLGFIAVLIVVSGMVKIMLLHEKRKAILIELDEFREERQKSIQIQLKDRKGKDSKKYFCGTCFYLTNTYSKRCPECGKGVLEKTGVKK